MLQNILEHKRVEIANAKASLPLHVLQAKIEKSELPRNFPAALRKKGIAVIAEVKKASPSRGVLIQDFQPVSIAREFENNGASALSVLTDSKFFQGDPAYIGEIKSAVKLPVLRKDFILDEYQVYESRYLGADAILLIASALPQDSLTRLYECAQSLGLGVLVEVHSAEEVHRVNAIQAKIIGVNNRDLSSFNVSLDMSLELKPLIHSNAITVSESGISTTEHVAVLRKAGFNAILVGEGLMTSSNKGRTLQQLVQAE